MEADNSEELDEEAVDNPSGTASSEVPNHLKGKRESLLAKFSSRNRALLNSGQGSAKPRLIQVQESKNTWKAPLYLYQYPDLGLQKALNKSLKEY